MLEPWAQGSHPPQNGLLRLHRSAGVNLAVDIYANRRLSNALRLGGLNRSDAERLDKIPRLFIVKVAERF